jgi:hypothetical protein
MLDKMRVKNRHGRFGRFLAIPQSLPGASAFFLSLYAVIWSSLASCVLQSPHSLSSEAIPRLLESIWAAPEMIERYLGHVPHYSHARVAADKYQSGRTRKYDDVLI